LGDVTEERRSGHGYRQFLDKRGSANTEYESE
jgi:hypothetical protein